MKGMNQQLDGRIIEAFRDGALSGSTSEIWRAKLEHDGTPRFRDDKRDANHISVVNSVVESIKDAVSEQDLKDAAYSIRKAFKERAAERERREVEDKRRMAEAERRRKQEAEERRREEVKRKEEEMGRGREGTPEGMEVEDDGPRYDDE